MNAAEIFRSHRDLIHSAWLASDVPATRDRIYSVTTTICNRIGQHDHETQRDVHAAVCQAWDAQFRGNLRRQRNAAGMPGRIVGKVYRLGGRVYATRAGALSGQRAQLRATSLATYQGSCSGSYCDEIEVVIVRENV